MAQQPISRIGSPERGRWRFIGIALTCTLSAFSIRPASAQTTYTYIGNHFTLFSCGLSSGGGTADCEWGDPRINSSYTASNHVTATMVFSSPLPPNLNFQDVRNLPGFELTVTDGVQTLHSEDYPGGTAAQVSTDANGNIIAPWYLQVYTGGTVNHGIDTYDEPPFSSDDALLACCDPTVQGNLAFNQSAQFPPGTGPGLWGTGGIPPSAIYPAGTFTRTTQFTTCCDGFVVSNDDNIAGGINKPLTFGGAGGGDGDNVARASFTPVTLDASSNPPSVTNNGPSVGAYSDSNLGVGFGRAIAFATFTNNSSTTHLRAHGNLSGEFLHDWFGLPDGTLAAGAAIHVFDADQFFAAISSATDGSDAAIGRFLLGGPAAGAGITPDVNMGSLDALLSSALIGHDQKLYSNGPFNPPGPINDTLNAAFTIPAGKNYTVVFDVAASGMVQGNPQWEIGTGFVNFLDTLKPSPVFFTDDNGNPVSGIGVLGALSSLPAAASGLTLAPSTGTLAMEHPYTVTATASDSSNKPVSGAPIKFLVADGPDAGVSGAGITDVNGNVTFTYTGQGGAGTDTIQASTGSLISNTVKVTWQAAACPAGQGFWKNHSNAWPVTSLTLGGQTYSQAELLALLNQPGGGDASMILAVQLIAAKLSIANGSDPAPIRAAGAAADTLLRGFTGKLPYNVKPSTSVGQSMTQTANTLESFTEGGLTPQCSQ